MAKEYFRNARKATPEFYKMLEDNIKELGDLSGITHDLTTDEIITGNQRCKVIKLEECEIVITKNLKSPILRGSVAFGYVNWKGTRLNYRQVKWDDEQRAKANVTANSIMALWDEDIFNAKWQDVPEFDKWNVPFILDAPMILDNDIQKSVTTSNKYHDVKPFVFISFNLIQKKIDVPEAEAKQFLDGLIKLGEKGSETIQSFYNDVYRLAFDRMQELKNEGDGKSK